MKMTAHFFLFTASACILVTGLGLSAIPGAATLCDILYTCSAVSGVLGVALLINKILRG